jgi:hypothetical protein
MQAHLLRYVFPNQIWTINHIILFTGQLPFADKEKDKDKDP